LPYVRDWEPLPDVLRLVMAVGSQKQEAKVDICNAVADRKIAVRVLVHEAESGVGGRTLSDSSVSVPPRLTPQDFDWVHSRPLAQWETGPHSVPELVEGSTWHWRPRKIKLIELFIADIASVLCDRVTSSRAEGNRIDAPRDVPAPLSPIGRSAPPGERKRGPEPRKRKAVVAKMLSDIESNVITKEELRTMLEKQLEERYSVSRCTARNARNDVLGES